MNLGPAYAKVNKMWSEAKASGANGFMVPMKNGRTYRVRHFDGTMMNMNGSFYIYDNNGRAIVGDISNTTDLAEILVGLGKAK